MAGSHGPSGSTLSQNSGIVRRMPTSAALLGQLRDHPTVQAGNGTDRHRIVLCPQHRRLLREPCLPPGFAVLWKFQVDDVLANQ